MTWEWLQRRNGVARLAERVDLLERQLADARDVAQEAAGRIATAERLTVETAAAVATMHGQVRALRRVMRSGAGRLDRAAAAGAATDARTQAYQAEVARLTAAIAFIEGRIEEEAEQARRGIAGLFDQLKARRAAPRVEATHVG